MELVRHKLLCACVCVCVCVCGCMCDRMCDCIIYICICVYQVEQLSKAKEELETINDSLQTQLDEQLGRVQVSRDKDVMPLFKRASF